MTSPRLSPFSGPYVHYGIPIVYRIVEIHEGRPRYLTLWLGNPFMSTGVSCSQAYTDIQSAVVDAVRHHPVTKRAQIMNENEMLLALVMTA